MKTLTFILLLISCSVFGQSNKHKKGNLKVAYSHDSIFSQEKEDNYFIATRHLDPMKNQPADMFYEYLICKPQFDIYNDRILLFEPIKSVKNGCLIKTCIVKTKEELKCFKNTFPHVKIPQRILSKIK